MADVHFSFNAPDRLLTACRIAARCYRNGERLAVYCTDKRRLHAFNRLLWEYERAAFVPHLPAADPLAAHTPIVLYDAPPGSAHAVVLNLDDGCVPPADGVRRIVEIVDGDPAGRASARERWRAYQSAGHTIVRHDIARQHSP